MAQKLEDDAFVDPATGIVMHLGRWYILSDSGSAYVSQGFMSALAAKQCAEAEFFHKQYGTSSSEVSTPQFLGAENGWGEMTAVNIILADDIRTFFMHQTPQDYFNAQK